MVKLDVDDTYAVEIGRLRRPRGGDLEYEVLEQHRVFTVMGLVSWLSGCAWCGHDCAVDR